MKIKYILTVIALAAFTQGSYAQYAQDAINFSGSQYGSTSRVKALGNAGTAIGGDLSSININPAGIGFFTRSELSFTPEYNGGKTNSLFYGNASQVSKGNVNVSNASVVLYSQLANRNEDKTKGWLSLNFGASYSRTNNLNTNAFFEGEGSGNGSSIADWYAEMGHNTNFYSTSGPVFPENSLEGFAYRQGLTRINPDDPTSDGDEFYNIQANTYLNPSQQNTIVRKGDQSEVNFAIGANYSNKLYLGLGLGINTIRSDFSSTFSEQGGIDEDPSEQYNTSYLVDQSTRGTGFNLKAGAIYKPNNIVRIGATITTPTWYNIDDLYSETVETRIGGASTQSNGNDYQTQYNLVTPFKASLGLAIFAGDHGFITGDVEYIDYKNTSISSDDYDPTFDNEDINDRYKSAFNIRAGAEARLTNAVFLRGGYSIQGSPQKELQSSIKTASGGIGFRKGAYYLDATYSHSSGNSFYAPYLVSDSYADTQDVTNPNADIKRQFNNVLLTFGYRF